jgi:hypothetical protein
MDGQGALVRTLASFPPTPPYSQCQLLQITLNVFKKGDGKEDKGVE